MLEVFDDYARSLAAYLLADVLLVNPIRDGMNLVAKEGPILAGRGCALVLSREAGAADELGPDALLVNPYDITATAGRCTRHWPCRILNGGDAAVRSRRPRPPCPRSCGWPGQLAALDPSAPAPTLARPPACPAGRRPQLTGPRDGGERVRQRSSRATTPSGPSTIRSAYAGQPGRLGGATADGQAGCPGGPQPGDGLERGDVAEVVSAEQDRRGIPLFDEPLQR